MSVRTQYTEEQRETVRTRYGLCRTIKEKEELAREVGIDSVHKLYNLASRIGVTRTNGEFAVRPDQPDDPSLERIFADLDRYRARESFSQAQFSAANDDFIRRNFGAQSIERISYHIGHTVSATLYRARHLGLRRPARYWDAEHVARWLCIDEDQWDALAEQGLVRHRLADRAGRVKLSVVASVAIARWLVRGNRWQRLIAERDADEFFCREIIESVADLQARATDWEACAHLSAGHSCNNTYSSTGFGLFCSDNERFSAGCDPKCGVRQLRPEDLRPGAT